MSENDRCAVGSERSLRFNYVANYRCKNCGYERTVKTRLKVGKFDDECDESGYETTFGLTMEPMDIERFAEELIER